MPPKWSNKRTSTNKHTDPDSGEDYDPLNLSSDEESELIKPLQRMTIKQTTTMDPPRNGNGPRALVRMAEMKCRDTDVFLKTIVVQREHGMLLIIDKLEGVHPEDIHVTRCLKDKRMITLEWNSTIPDVETVYDLFCSGKFLIGTDPVNLLRTDAFVQDIIGAVKEVVGSQRHQVLPKTRYSIVLDRPVKPKPSLIQTTLQTGESIFVCTTLFGFGCLCYIIYQLSLFWHKVNLLICQVASTFITSLLLTSSGKMLMPPL
jgi:hypothetical protein